ncbi:MAG: alpha/beta fold hydrolase [Steroidobacteraceae bacterium]
MRRLLFCMTASLAVSIGPAAHAAQAPAPRWLTLPPTPTLPKAVASGYAPVDGIRLWYAEFGRGQPVILLHGGLANANYWGNQVRALEGRYRVIVMDSLSRPDHQNVGDAAALHRGTAGAPPRPGVGAPGRNGGASVVAEKI